MLREVSKLAQEGRFDYLLIESTGISEPAPVAFTYAIADNQSLSDIAEFDTMVTVVDCLNFLMDLKIGEDLQSQGTSATPDDVRTVADLVIDQVEFADVIVLNKTDLVSADELARIEGFLEQLNPYALKVHSEFGKVPLTKIPGTHRFDFERARTSRGWQLAVNGGEKSWRWAVEKRGALEWRIGCGAGWKVACSGMEEAGFTAKLRSSQLSTSKSLELLRLCRAAA